MTARFVGLSVDANDPLHLARLWAAALRWEINEETGAECVGLVPTDGTTFGIVFQEVAKPKAGRDRIHLDLTTTSVNDQEDSVSSLLELGARRIDIGQGPDAAHVVLADPEGNLFCVFEPEALVSGSFYDGCRRLAALNCLGSREVGQFWSTALGWPLVWDENGETAIREQEAAGAYITWTPALPKTLQEWVQRQHLHIAPCDEHDQRTEIQALLALGAIQLDIDKRKPDRALMADQDGNEFCVLPTSP